MNDSFENLVADAVSHAESSEGWDFSFLDGRRHTEAVPWSFEDAVVGALSSADSLLDMDTGGGERLASLHRGASSWPSTAVATEGYLPNIPVARRNLATLGIEVVPYESCEHLPFASAKFDLILNRHGNYSPPEIRRMLRGGGTFLTEQVGADMCMGLNRLLHAAAEQRSPWNVQHAAAELESAGLQLIEQSEHRGADWFDDIGAVVWYLIKVPWQIPDFSVTAYDDRLRALHEEIQRSGPIEVGSHHFLLVAKRTEGVSA